MDQAARLDYLIREARRRDPERAFCALFATGDAREALLGLVLLNDELARVPEATTQPMAAMIRYQWWRDALGEAAAGSPRAHPVVEALAGALAKGGLPLGFVEGLIDAREGALDEVPLASLTALEARIAATAGALQEAALCCLDGAEPATLAAGHEVGTAFGLVGTLRSHRAILAAGRPSPLATLLGQVAEDALPARAEALLAQARTRTRRPLRRLMPAFLPARFAVAYARRLRRGEVVPKVETLPPLAVLDLTLSRTLRRY